MQTSSDIYKPYLAMLSGGNPLVCLDNRFCCAFSPDGKFKPGESLLGYIRRTVPEPLGRVMEFPFYKDDKFSCCRIYPIKNEIGESVAYICEIFSAESARHIGELTDSPSDILALYNAVEMNISAVWASSSRLRVNLSENRDYARLADVLAIEGAMSNISAVCGNAFEYANMLYQNQKSTVIDAGEMVLNLAERCNAALAKCGRRVEVLTEPQDLHIYADSRRAVVALVNAVQNALLYSPKDTEPILAVYRREQRGRSFIEFRITNDSSMFSGKDFSGGRELNFSYQRVGYGIPIIKRFAAVSGGSFSMTEEHGKVIVTITLPAANGDYGMVTLKSPYIAAYDTGRPDFVTSMMYDVVQFFGEMQDP